MKKIIFTVFFAALLMTACINMGERVNGSGNVKTENRQVPSAERIRVAGDMDVYISQGATAVKVEGDDNVLQYIETSMNDNWLEIKTRDDVNINTSNPVKVYITTPNVTDLKVTGSGNISGSDEFACDRSASFEVTGSGDIRFALRAPRVESHISGSGNLHLSGETKDVEIHIAGSGNYDGAALKAENANVSIAGSGDANLFADNKLKASITGSGSVRYQGNATVDSHVAGSGTVSKE